MLKFNQKGIVVLEMMLLIIVIALIGYIGFRLLDSNDQDVNYSNSQDSDTNYGDANYKDSNDDIASEIISNIDRERKEDMAYIASAITGYIDENNGKTPTIKMLNNGILDDYIGLRELGCSLGVDGKNGYIFTDSDPSSCSQMQYSSSGICEENKIVANNESFALRIWLVDTDSFSCLDVKI